MLKKLRKKRNKKGFTLVELIVVIAILGILVAIAVPRFVGFRERAALSADQASAETIGKAAELYLIDNPGETPDMEKLKTANLLKDKDIKSKTEKVNFEVTAAGDDDEIEVKAGTVIFYPEYNGDKSD